MLHEAGVFGYVIVVVFALGVVALLAKGRQDPVRAATPFVLALLALGNVGYGLGQRLVRDAVERVPDVGQQVKFLNLGTGEAVANVVLGGSAALLLVVVAAAVAWSARTRA